MASTDLDITPGAPASPTISRTTNVPSIELFSFCTFIQFVTYEDFTWPMAIEDTGGSGINCLIEGTSAGIVILADGISTQDYWIDGFTGWAFLAAVGTAATTIGYYQKAGGAFTATGTLTSPAGATNFMSGGFSSLQSGSANGRIRLVGTRWWAASLTQQEMVNESQSVFPRRFANLSFFNHGLVPSNYNVDLSGTGGAFALNGVPASSAEYPGFPWQRSRTYGYAA